MMKIADHRLIAIMYGTECVCFHAVAGKSQHIYCCIVQSKGLQDIICRDRPPYGPYTHTTCLDVKKCELLFLSLFLLRNTQAGKSFVLTSGTNSETYCTTRKKPIKPKERNCRIRSKERGTREKEKNNLGS
jgi:hypothetical protein